MLITSNFLQEYDAPALFVQYVKRKYPNGTDLIEVLNDIKLKDIDNWLEYTSWCQQFLYLDNDDNELLARSLNNIGSVIFTKSTNLDNCSFVSNIKNARNCSYIHYCSDMDGCSTAVNCNNCTNCLQIYNTQYSKNSRNLIDCNSCDNCINTIKSNFILNSKSIYNSKSIINSDNLEDCEQCKDIHFSSKCHDLSHSFFCYNVSGEYLLFNKPYEPELYDMIIAQYNSLRKELDFHTDYPETELLIATMPTFTYNYKKHYMSQTKQFWDWAQSLPNYNAYILYNITCLEQFI